MILLTYSTVCYVFIWKKKSTSDAHKKKEIHECLILVTSCWELP